MTVGRLPPVNDPSFGGKAQNALDQLQAQKHTRNTPVKLAEYTVSGLPPAADWTYCLVFVTNAASGPTPAWSDATNWRSTSGNTIIS